MSERGMLVIKESNLSLAWLRAMTSVAAPGVASVVPLIVNISNFDGDIPPEDKTIRHLVNSQLLAGGKKFCTVDTTADTIFPESIWRRYQRAGAHEFFRRYAQELAPRLRQIDHRNRKGTYFERMVNYRGTNQLAHILSTWASNNHRTSALQAAIFDAREDHTRQPFLGFPCLDHIAFASDGTGLSLVAFYASQYIFDRAYGNYLGLSRLGRFIGNELQVPFRQLTCIAGAAKMGTISKKQVATFVQSCQSAVSQGSSFSPDPANNARGMA